MFFTANITSQPNDNALEDHLFDSARPELIGIYFQNIQSALPDKFSYVLRQSISSSDFHSYQYDSDLARAQIMLNLNFIRYQLEKQKKTNMLATLGPVSEKVILSLGTYVPSTYLF